MSAIKPETPPPAKPQLTQVQAIVELAHRGNQRILPQLRQLLAQAPHIADSFGDVALMAERALIDRIAGPDLMISESLRIKTDEMREELAGPNPSAVERLLVDRLVVSWLSSYEADLGAVLLGGTGNVKLEELRIKRLDAAHRRVLSAAKTLAQVRRLVGGLRVEIHHHGEASADAPATGPVRDQIRQAMAAGMQVDRGLVRTSE